MHFCTLPQLTKVLLIKSWGVRDGMRSRRDFWSYYTAILYLCKDWKEILNFLLISMQHCGKFKNISHPKIPRGSWGIDFIFLDPWGMLNCHSSRNQIFWGIVIPIWWLLFLWDFSWFGLLNSLIFCTFISNNFAEKHLVLFVILQFLKITSLCWPKCAWWALHW